MKKELEEKQAEIERAKVAAETMFSGLGGGATDGTEPQRRRQEIHWDYDKKGLYIFTITMIPKFNVFSILRVPPPAIFGIPIYGS